MAKGASGFAWQPIATLKPGDIDAAAWTGYSCLTGTGRYVVSVVAPSDYTNSPTLRDQGGFAYVTTVATGVTRPLVSGVAIKYYSPGCGSGDAVVLTRNLGSDEAVTQLITANAATASLGTVYTAQGQVTSSVPDAHGGVLGARGSNLVQFSGTATEKKLARVSGQIYDIAAASDGTATFLTHDGSSALVTRMSSTGKITKLASGPLASTEVFPGRAGRAVIVAKSLRGAIPAADGSVVTRTLPNTVDAPSLDGQIVAGRNASAKNAASLAVSSQVTGAKVTTSSTLPSPAAATTALPSKQFAINKTAPGTVPSQKTNAKTSTPNISTGPTDPGCAIPRLDPTLEAPQPGKAQVERAVDLAVTGQLVDTRPANYMNMGLAAYEPSNDFPPHALSNGGSVPAQVYLGILAQESNMAQASWHELPGVAGAPLISDYYGDAGGITTIDYAKSDCGYGIGQITTGMDNNDNYVYSTHGQMKIAVDYEENIAAGLQILEDKWNQLRTAGIIANDGSAQYIENWYFAIWAYNTGINPGATTGNTTGCTPSPSCTDSSGNWGLGWSNNPADPDYPPGRDVGFLDQSYADASHPGNWPYQERVFGWINHPLQNMQDNGNPSYATPSYGSAQPQYVWGDGNAHSGLYLPSEDQFCSLSMDDCTPASDGIRGQCGLSNFHCWLHQSVTWITGGCATQCATQRLSYTAGSVDPGVTDPDPPECNSTLPASAIIVSNLANIADNPAGCTSMNWVNQGTFSLAYETDANGNPTGAIDTHQAGLGFGGHLYFTHNRTESDLPNLVTGTWKASLPTHYYNVFVHMPNSGATTDYANYQITTADGGVQSSVVSQHTNANEWVSLGYYNMSNNAQVSLSNITTDAVDGAHDVAFDSVAFVPVAGTTVTHTFDAVSIFSPDQDLDTNAPSSFNTPMRSMSTLYDWMIDRTVGGPDWNGTPNTNIEGLLQFPTCASIAAETGSCIAPDLYTSTNQWLSQVEDAGAVPTGNQEGGGMTMAKLLGMANPTPNPATSPSQAFASNLSYKIKTHISITWLSQNGLIVPGSQDLLVNFGTGDTSVPQFVINFMNAVQKDYGVAVPNLSYSETDANEYTMEPETVPNPLSVGSMPALAYMPHYSAPVLDTANDCFAVKTVTGGADGFRPLDTQTGSTDANTSAWVSDIRSLQSEGKLPQQVGDTANDIYNMFFRAWQAGGLFDGSLYNFAPPIWQEVGLEFCNNGTVVPNMAETDGDDTPSNGLVYQSYMPDLYLYFDGKMVNESGSSTTSPVQKGNFGLFSNVPLVDAPSGANNPFFKCNTTERGNGGNPWNVEPPLPGVSQNALPDTVQTCDDQQTYLETYSP